jgi:hypothetical protein
MAGDSGTTDIMVRFGSGKVSALAAVRGAAHAATSVVIAMLSRQAARRCRNQVDGHAFRA